MGRRKGGGRRGGGGGGEEEGEREEGGEVGGVGVGKGKKKKKKKGRGSGKRGENVREGGRVTCNYQEPRPRLPPDLYSRVTVRLVSHANRFDGVIRCEVRRVDVGVLRGCGQHRHVPNVTTRWIGSHGFRETDEVPSRYPGCRHRKPIQWNIFEPA